MKKTIAKLLIPLMCATYACNNSQKIYENNLPGYEDKHITISTYESPRSLTGLEYHMTIKNDSNHCARIVARDYNGDLQIDDVSFPSAKYFINNMNTDKETLSEILQQTLERNYQQQ